MLADDMLDDDPRGLHQSSGPGAAANLSLAFQAVAFKLIETSSISKSQKAAASNSLAHAALATAFGQHLDDQSLPGEENYWAVVSAKSTPFYGSCYALGAIAAGADQLIIDGLYDFGVLIGEIIQIQDDLEDAFSRPVNPDWQRQGNNILIIYALNAEYADRSEFDSLLPEIAAGDDDSLKRAQEILIGCGAVSYAAYHLVQRYQQTWNLISALSLTDPTPITDILNDFGTSLSI
jgi:geranylgeranyl pyrophosphate synthase